MRTTAPSWNATASSPFEALDLPIATKFAVRLQALDDGMRVRRQLTASDASAASQNSPSSAQRRGGEPSSSVKVVGGSGGEPQARTTRGQKLRCQQPW